MSGVHYVLSPHLDDAALSIGGLIARLTEQGERVCVVTVMAGDPPASLPDTPIVRDLHQRWAAGSQPVAARRAEDEAALTSLGAQWHHLSVPDCVYRVSAEGEALYPSESSLFGQPNPLDPGFVLLDTLLGSLLADATTVFAPMGVGSHVDHQLVRDWVLRQQGMGSLALNFYEEYPYSKQEHAVDWARDQLATAVKPHPWLLDQAHIMAKIASIACYTSQISSFWPDLAAMKQQVMYDFRSEQPGLWMETCWVP